MDKLKQLKDLIMQNKIIAAVIFALVMGVGYYLGVDEAVYNYVDDILGDSQVEAPENPTDAGTDDAGISDTDT